MNDRFPRKRRGVALACLALGVMAASSWAQDDSPSGPGQAGSFRDAISREEAGLLTQQESDWIDNHPVIRLGFNTDCPPFSFVTHEGELGGVVSDYEFHLSRFIGFPFSIQAHTTEDLLDLARSGKIDVIATLDDQPELRSEFLFMRPFVLSPLVVVMRADAPVVENLASLKGKRFVFQGRYPGAYRRLRQDYPWMKPAPVSTVEQGLERVRSGQADACIGSLATVVPALNTIGSDLRVVLSTPYSARIGFAVRKDWPILVDILNKGLGAISSAERDRILTTWVATPRDKFNWRRLTTVALVVLGVAALLLVAIAAWNRLLMREIAFRQKYELELRQARDAADAANQAKSMFLANMSHEIRTPLNVVIGFAQILARDPALPRESREQVDTILRSGEHLLGLINDILEISKIEAAQISVDPISFDLLDLLRDLETMFLVRAGAKGIGLRVTAEPGVPRRIVADLGKIRQILINLVGNAVKFTQAGRVSVRVASLSVAGHPRLRCEVEDTGPGVSPQDQESIFGAFVQGEGMSGTRGGTGLGLTISRRYAKLLGGDIVLVRTELGTGSLFAFEMPFTPAESGPAASVSVSREVIHARMPDGRAPRVLVVEDESINRRVIVRALETMGFEIREAADGEEALAQFDAGQPDLVLMDIRMPRMDGIEATARIRKRPGGQSVPVVALTASAFESDKDRILAGGLSGYIRKPFKLPELLQVITEHVPMAYEQVPAFEAEMLSIEGGALAEAMRWPAPLRAAICQAAREADVAEIETLLLTVPDSATVVAIRRLLEAYDYPALVAALSEPPAGLATKGAL